MTNDRVLSVATMVLVVVMALTCTAFSVAFGIAFEKWQQCESQIEAETP